MDVFNFCWSTLLAESKKCSVFFDKDTCNVKNEIDENFNKPVSRIAYLYKFGSYNICFFHKCFKEFFTKVSVSSKIIDDFRSIKNLTICSMSAGPGTDIIGLLYSLHLINSPLMNPTTFRIISEHGTWRNVVTEMISSSIISMPEGSTCHLIGSTLNSLSKKAQNYVKTADILLMCHFFPSSVTSKERIRTELKVIIELLKPGAVVFLIFSKEKATSFKEMHSSGSFLYGPVEITLENMPYNEKVAELVGVKPLSSGRSMFAVWKKFEKINPEKNVPTVAEVAVCSDQLSSTNLMNNKCDKKHINFPTLKMSGSISEFSSDSNISSSSSVRSSPRCSSSSISCHIRKDKPVNSDHSANFNVSNVDFSKSAKTVSRGMLNASDSLVGQEYASPSQGSQKKKENTDNLNSLLQNFERLITKFEGFISSQDSLKNSCVKEQQSSSCQHCHQYLQKDQYIKPCECHENGLTSCCQSVICNYVNVGSQNNSSSQANNLSRTLHQEGPCIVIPLQNLSNESLSQILSIVSQSCSSVNEVTSNLISEGRNEIN